MKTFRIRSTSDLPEVAEAILDARAGRTVIAFRGGMGAGKTTLIRGACRALGVTGPVTSPTFTIGQRYRGRVPVSHLDLYRLGGIEEEDPALLEDYLRPDSVAFIEWPGAAEPVLDRVTRRISIRHAGGDRREVESA